MKYTNIFGLWVLAGVLAATGCGSPPAKPVAGGGPGNGAAPTTTPKKDDHTPHGKGPNGGVVFDLGKYHAEFTVDHDKKECTIITIGADEKTPTAVAAKEFTLTTKATKTKDGKAVSPMTVTLKVVDEKDGKAMKFVGTDPGLGNVADFEGTVAGEIDGKPSSGEFKE